MTTETILTHDQIRAAIDEAGPDNYFGLSRAIEQAVLQSPEIQALRKDAEAVKDKDAEIRKLRSLVSEMADNDTYETEYDGRMYSICHDCGAQDGEDHRTTDCLYVRAQAAMEQKT